MPLGIVKILKSVYLAQLTPVLKRNVIGAVLRNNVIVTHENNRRMFWTALTVSDRSKM